MQLFVKCCNLHPLLIYDKMDNDVSKSTCLEPTIKHLMKETRIFRMEELNLVIRGHNEREGIYLIAKFPLKSIIGRSIYNKIKILSREEIVEWIISNSNVKPSCISSVVVTVLNPVSNQREVFQKC